MKPKFRPRRRSNSDHRNRQRTLVGWIVTFGFIFSVLFSSFNISNADAAGTSYGGGGGGSGGGLSGLPVLGVHTVGTTAATFTLNIPGAIVTIVVPAGTFPANSQIAVLNAASIAHSPSGWGAVSFAYAVAGKSATGTFITTFTHSIRITIASVSITGRQGVYKLSGTTWVAFTPTTNVSGSLSYYSATSQSIEVVNPPSTTTTTRPVATTTTTRPVATTTTTRPVATTTTTRPVVTTTTTHPVTTTTRPPTTTTTRAGSG